MSMSGCRAEADRTNGSSVGSGRLNFCTETLEDPNRSRIKRGPRKPAIIGWFSLAHMVSSPVNVVVSQSPFLLVNPPKISKIVGYHLIRGWLNTFANLRCPAKNNFFAG